MCLVLCGHTQRKGFNGEYGSSFSGGFELSLVILTLGMVRPVRVGEPLYCWPCLPFFPCRLRGECECGVGEGEGGAASVGAPTALPFQVSNIGPGLHFFLPSSDCVSGIPWRSYGNTECCSSFLKFLGGA